MAIAIVHAATGQDTQADRFSRGRDASTVSYRTTLQLRSALSRWCRCGASIKVYHFCNLSSLIEYGKIAIFKTPTKKPTPTGISERAFVGARWG